MLKSIFEVQEVLDDLRAQGGSEPFGVFYASVSNPSNKHYVILRSDAEFENLKRFHRDYDFKFNRLAV